MQDNRLKLQERYERFYPNEGLDHEQLNHIKKSLNIALPPEFLEIAKFFSGGYLGGISHYSFTECGVGTNIISETLRLRNAINLPERFVVLAEPPASLIVMDTIATPSIIWLDAVEVSKLGNQSLDIEADEWATYEAYFSELLEEEEVEQLM